LRNTETALVHPTKQSPRSLQAVNGETSSRKRIWALVEFDEVSLGAAADRWTRTVAGAPAQRSPPYAQTAETFVASSREKGHVELRPWVPEAPRVDRGWGARPVGDPTRLGSVPRRGAPVAGAAPIAVGAKRTTTRTMAPSAAQVADELESVRAIMVGTTRRNSPDFGA